MADSNAQKFWTLITRAADLFRSAAFHTDTALEKISVSQQNVIGAVYSHPDCGLMVKDIAEHINVTPGAVSQTVESLVKLGMLERVHSEQDRRAVFVRATPRGAAIREKLVDKVDPILHEVLAEVGPKGRDAFLNIMEKLVAGLAALNEQEKKAKSAAASQRMIMEEVL